MNIVDRFIKRGTAFDRTLPIFIALATVVLLTGWFSADISSMALLQWTAPNRALPDSLLPRVASPSVAKISFGKRYFCGPRGIAADHHNIL
ncbi:hypothetical protein [Paraburkholderia sp. JHI869]|uniref:hypothetical protein n=1 Tax=Paraburkholderia sp. JHI869 TaxID=3112959 RepID=UPI00317D7C08